MNYEDFEKIEEFRELYNAIPNHLQNALEETARTDFDKAIINNDIYLKINEKEYLLLKYFRYLNTEYADFYKYVVSKHYYDNRDNYQSYSVAEFSSKYDAIEK